MRKFTILLAVSALAVTCGWMTANMSSAATNEPDNSWTSNISGTSAAALPTPTPDTNPELDFTIVNKTGYAIKKLYIGVASQKDWADDDEVLKGRKFADGASYEITFHPKTAAKKWDIMVEWADGSPNEEWLNLNLTKIEKITLKYNKAKDETTAEIQ